MHYLYLSRLQHCQQSSSQLPTSAIKAYNLLDQEKSKELGINSQSDCLPFYDPKKNFPNKKINSTNPENWLNKVHANHCIQNKQDTQCKNVIVMFSQIAFCVKEQHKMQFFCVIKFKVYLWMIAGSPFDSLGKNPTYGRQSISQPMRIVAPIPQQGGPRIPKNPNF